MIPSGISDLKGRAAIASVLVAILALALAASASAGKPFPRIARDAAVSCSQAKAKVSVAVAWKKANRKGGHRGHAVLLLKGKKSGEVEARKLSSKRLRSARTQKISYRFRFGTRASKRLCRGSAKAEVVASHGHDKDRADLVEIYRVTRRTLDGKASASGSARTARALGAPGSGPPDPEAIDAGSTTGSDCQEGGANATIKDFAQLQDCDLSGTEIIRASLFAADLSGANLTDANLTGTTFQNADLPRATLENANFTDANFSGADLSNAILVEADLTRAGFFVTDLTGADLTGANLTDASLATATLENTNCWGATKRDGSSTYPTPVDPTGVPTFVPC